MFSKRRILFQYGCVNDAVYVYGFFNVFATHGWIRVSFSHVVYSIKT